MICDECGFDDASVTPADSGETIRAFGRRYRAPLTRLLPGEDDSVLRAQPAEGVWSAIEYASHMRDVLQLWGWMLHKALTEDRPSVPRMTTAEVDATVAAYGRLDAAEVVAELAANADRMAAKIDKLTPPDWERTILFGDEELSSLEIVRKAAHEGNHHLLDIGRGLRTVRGR